MNRSFCTLALLVMGLCIATFAASPPGGAAAPRTSPGMAVPTRTATERTVPALDLRVVRPQASILLASPAIASPSVETIKSALYGPPVPVCRYDAPALPVLRPPRK